MSSNFQMVGNWRKELERPLALALEASVRICGRTFSEACKHAIILMAQSAKKLTPKAPLKRPVAADVHTRAEFITIYKKDGSTSRVFKFMFGDPGRGGAGATLKGTWAQAQKIARRGLAQNSWMWGLKGLNAGGTSKPIPGVAYIKSIVTDTHVGYILRDSLKYLMKILPTGWEQRVQQSAENRIMKQAQMKLERDWRAEMRKSFRAGQAAGGGIGKYFLRI